MKITLKDAIERCKNHDKKYNVNTQISVYLTAIGNDNKRHTVIINPDSERFMDRMTLTGFEDCIVTDINRFIISDTYHLLVVIVDVEAQWGD